MAAKKKNKDSKAWMIPKVRNAVMLDHFVAVRVLVCSEKAKSCVRENNPANANMYGL